MDGMVEDEESEDRSYGCPYIEFGARAHTTEEVLPIKGS